MAVANRLWITYAWADNDEGDFAHLVRSLEGGGVSTIYDKIALIPGQRLWEQIADRIGDGSLAGWAYLVTPRSILSVACREELEYALDRALRARGDRFPLIGLLHGVPIAEVPLPLRVRLCVDLSSPTWVEEVRAGLERRAPRRPPSESETENLRVAVHNPYQGDATLYAVEFRPRFGELRYWRIAYPAGITLISRGTGPVGGGAVGSMLTDVIMGTVPLADRQMEFFGAGTAITPGTAAYVVFRNENPDFLAFSVANAPFDIPERWIPLRFRG
jgi:hypothetical protein